MKSHFATSLFFCLLTIISLGMGLGLKKNLQEREEYLDSNKNYLVRWTIDYDEQILNFTVIVNNTGFVGFGISPTGGMTGADIVIGGIFPNGTSYFTDRHGIGNTLPVVDDEQNWFLENAAWNGSHTSLSFYRKFDTCDDADVRLTNDTTNFIWSYSNSHEISYHGSSNRGTFTVQPLDPPTPDVDLSKYLTYEIKNTMVMPNVVTTYWCTIHKSPTFLSKHHIVAFEPLLRSPEALAYAHHYNIYRCTPPAGSGLEEYFEKYVGGEGGECFVEKPVIPSEHCQNMFYNWAIGGRMLVLPENIGYPIGETGSPVDYYMFEIHLNNPNEVANVSLETGAIIYYTDEPRELDAGLMVVAHQTSIGLTIPPGSLNYKLVGHCDVACTENYLPEDGINVFAMFMHSHLSGRKMRFRQFRGAEELPWPANDESFDFEFQQTRLLSQEIKVLRGDHLAMECIYDNTWTSGVSIGGLSTKEEMCLSIFWYYPRAELRDCRSEYPVQKLFEKFGIINATRGTPYEDAIITAPESMAGLRYSEVLNTLVNWTPELKKELQNDFLLSPHEGVCWTDTQTVPIEKTGYPDISKEYVPIRDC